MKKEQLIAAREQKLIEQKEAWLVNLKDEWVSAHVEADMKEWLVSNPIPDEDEDGSHAVHCHEEDYEKFEERVQDHWEDYYDETVVPDEMDRFKINDLPEMLEKYEELLDEEDEEDD